MDAEQESRWAAAQGIGIGEDLVPAALRHLEFLAVVDRRRWLYEGPLLHRAIRRYKACWLPLLVKHTEAAVADEPLVVPLDCEWIWHCHRLNPTQYIKDCKRLYGRILDTNNVKSSIQAKSKDQAKKVWTELYPGEPFELEYTSPSGDFVDVGDGTAGGISYDLISAVKRQSSFVYQVGTPNMHDHRFLEDALARYKGFLYLIKMNQEKGMNLFRVPTYDVDLMWHTHQLNSVTYYNDMLDLLGRVLEHDDTDDDRAEGKKLDTGFSGTTEQFENTFGLRYWKVGAMYRGSLPSPVTSIPQIFSSEDDSVFGVDKAEKHLTILETTVVELYLQIVDIKNLPSAIPEKSVYVWFTKTQPGVFISDDGRLDISTKTGKSIRAGFQCEPTGELILTVMVDQAYFGASSSKKSKSLGKVSISLQELTQPDSKLSFERWFELKSRGAYAGSPPVSLRVAASCTVSMKACLLPHSIKDQNMSSWTRFVYDCGTELIRLQIREHKAKSGMALIRGLVGVTKSSKQPFQLAEFTKNKWSFNNSNLSITHDLKPSKDGCIHELKYGNKLIKLYRGRRLAYELKCCSQHAEDTTAVTAVKFSAEHPYGKAVALLDTESEFITVDEDWFLLPWIAISFLFLNSIGKDGVKLIEGAMVQKGETVEPDTTVASEMVKGGAAGATAGLAQCGACGTAGGGDMVMASDKDGHASCGGSVTASGKVADSKCGGCGSGCGGGSGVSVVTMSYKNGNYVHEPRRRTCELGTQYADLEKQMNQLQLDLEVTKRDLERAQTELKAMGDTMKKALEDKDKALADAQKVAKEKTEVAEKKLATVKKVEEENSKLKQERVTWTKDKEKLTKRAKGLEKYLGDFAQKMYSLLEDFCQDFDKETEEVEPNLDPTKSPVSDAVAMSMFRVEARIGGVRQYITRLRVAIEKIDKELWPEDSLQADLESMMARLENLTDRVQAWKKSAARCGADVALSLVRVHCKEAREDKLKALQVANTKKLQFENFMETFIAAATRIADGIDLDTFVEPASPSGP